MDVCIYIAALYTPGKIKDREYVQHRYLASSLFAVAREGEGFKSLGISLSIWNSRGDDFMMIAFIGFSFCGGEGVGEGMTALLKFEREGIQCIGKTRGNVTKFRARSKGCDLVFERKLA